MKRRSQARTQTEYALTIDPDARQVPNATTTSAIPGNANAAIAAMYRHAPGATSLYAVIVVKR